MCRHVQPGAQRAPSLNSLHLEWDPAFSSAAVVGRLLQVRSLPRYYCEEEQEGTTAPSARRIPVSAQHSIPSFDQALLLPPPRGLQLTKSFISLFFSFLHLFLLLSSSRPDVCHHRSRPSGLEAASPVELHLPPGSR